MDDLVTIYVFFSGHAFEKKYFVSISRTQSVGKG